MKKSWISPPYIDFNCISLTDMCILGKIRQNEIKTVTWDRL